MSKPPFKSGKPRGRSRLGLLVTEQYRKLRQDRGRKDAHADRIIPYMKLREILLLEELLSNLAPQKCLEWGSGYSTLHYPQFIHPEGTWLAIEHHPQWADRIDSLNIDGRVSVKCLAPASDQWTDAHNDGAYADLPEYVDYPGQFAPYDFILVDGRARVDCLERAFKWIQPHGIVALHDAVRPYYHPPLMALPNQLFFNARGKGSKGLWLGSREAPVERFLNVARHQWVWALHNWRK